MNNTLISFSNPFILILITPPLLFFPLILTLQRYSGKVKA
jgi:hypothetical protein